MYVQVLDGRFAGQMRDIEPGAALELIKAGRAKKMSFDAPPPAPEAPVIVAESAVIEESATRKKKGK